MQTHLYNLFINVVAGYRIPPGETSTDLAILAAIASSVLDKPLPAGTALLAEVGLAGELRHVHNLEVRVLVLTVQCIRCFLVFCAFLCTRLGQYQPLPAVC